ncbi:DUF423 domain-containing protein [Lysobacter koreensis]|uniref:DUF423 domain-containing protein n=1 Tax=Lysobacter koreensis TaxID=266122 RepID=A0ABW2YV66_9GAMM
MSSPAIPSSRTTRLLAFGGGLLAAASVALSAYAAHGFEGVAQSRLQTAAVFAFGHGVGLAALAPAAFGRMERIALLALLAGALLFSGSLVSNVLAQWPTTLAPTGGLLLIGGWVLWAVAALRR